MGLAETPPRCEGETAIGSAIGDRGAKEEPTARRGAKGKGQGDVAAVLSSLGGEVVTGFAPHLEGVLMPEVNEPVLARVRVVRPPPIRNLGKGKGGKVAPAMSIVFLT